MTTYNNFTITSDYVDQANVYVAKILSKDLPEDMSFHNLDHTLDVVSIVLNLAREAGCSPHEQEILVLAALFHDTGYIKTYEDHEAASEEIAREFLLGIDYPKDRLEQVLGCIRATKMDHKPEGKLEQLICDADLSHIGKKGFNKRTERLRQERNLLTDDKKTKEEWLEQNIAFLDGVEFKTDVAQQQFKKRKKKNLKKLKKKLKAANTEFNDVINGNKTALTIFKTALRNHIDLTNIADQKANIMLSINAVILTLGMPLFARYIIDTPHLVVPAVLFLITCFTTMIFATLATRPIKMSGDTSRELIDKGKSNLFFFGNFYNIDLLRYQSEMERIVANTPILEKSIVNDLYYLGSSLGQKYNRLRLCYSIFIIGFILTLTSFVGSLIYYFNTF